MQRGQRGGTPACVAPESTCLDALLDYDAFLLDQFGVLHDGR